MIFLGPLFWCLVSFAMTTQKNFPTDETSERLARWKNRWDEMQLGWHEDGVHAAILEHGDKFIPAQSSNDSATTRGDICHKPVRVFFPLCGKSVDMAHLAKLPVISQVVGVDGIRTALEEFSKDHPELAIQREATDDDSTHERLVGNKILLLKGDFFQLNDKVTDGRFEAIFDRASLVAIDPSLRDEYVQVIGRLIQPGGKILLVVIERISGTDEDLHGPPYSVPETEVRQLYENCEWVRSITKLESDGETARNAGRNMRSLFFLIEAK